MNSLTRKTIPLLLAFGSIAGAADFSYFTTLRAGFLGGDHELGIGGTSSANASTASFSYSGANPYWRTSGGAQNFQIGYVAATNTGFVSVFNQANVATTVNFNPAVALTDASSAIWSLPAANFFVQANPGLFPTSITVENLAFSSGISILSGSIPTSLTASQSGGTVNTSALTGPIVFNAASTGGDWILSGAIRFTGLLGNFQGFATGDALRFGFGASASDTPEPGTYVLMSLGLLAFGFIGKRRASGCRK